MKKSELKLFLKKIVTEAKLFENIQDPTKDEMFNFLRTMYGNEENFRDDAEVAIYWFANFFHGGQTSNLYSALSTSRFSPGPIANKPQPDSMEEVMYDDLVIEYAPESEEGQQIQKERNSLNEEVSPKNQKIIQTWIDQLGTRQAAYKMVSVIVEKMIHIGLEDLADTAPLANGLDGIEDALKQNDFQGALKIAAETAIEVVREAAGGEDIMEGFRKQSGGDLKIYKDREAGRDVYWMDNKDSGGKISIKPEKISKYTKQGYRIIDMNVAEGDEADAVNDMWAGSDDDLKAHGFKEPKTTHVGKQKSKKFFGDKPKTVQDIDWDRVKNKIDRNTLGENQDNVRVDYGTHHTPRMEPSYHIDSKEAWIAARKFIQDIANPNVLKTGAKVQPMKNGFALRDAKGKALALAVVNV